ncbi:MAG: pectin acetylesterase-family hydrolase [Kofleriaceae bacterium]
MHRPLVLLLVVAAGCADDSSNTNTTPDGGVDPMPDAAPAAPSIADVLDCGTVGSAGGLPQGMDLVKVELDPTLFPKARCNDGTQSVFYVRPAATVAGRGRWMLQLQGGGGCHDPESCARRWCSVDTNMGMEHMTSRNAPDAIGGQGILTRDSRNPYADANHVFVRYCSSDNHGGRTDPIDVDAHHPITMEPLRFRIEFHGREILDAVLSTLRHDGASIPGMPDLDDATDVVLAGASAGAGGVISTADHVGEVLRANNGNAAALRFAALIDSTFGPSDQALDWSTSTMCTGQDLCTFGAIMTYFSQMHVRDTDASCHAYHASRPGTEWMCQDLDHILRHHIATPFFVRQGLRDRLIMPNAVESMVTVPGRGLMTEALFEELVRAELALLANLPATAEEGGSITRVPGVFAPPCTKHETLSDNANAFGVSVTVNTVARTMFDAFTLWQSGQNQPVIWSMGMPADCP